MTRPLTTAEAAELVNCSPQTIARLCGRGEIVALNWRGRWKIRRDLFLRQLEGDRGRAPKIDLSVTAETKANGQPFSPAEIELRRKWRSSG